MCWWSILAFQSEPQHFKTGSFLPPPTPPFPSFFWPAFLPPLLVYSFISHYITGTVPHTLRSWHRIQSLCPLGCIHEATTLWLFQRTIPITAYSCEQSYIFFCSGFCFKSCSYGDVTTFFQGKIQDIKGIIQDIKEVKF